MAFHQRLYHNYNMLKITPPKRTKLMLAKQHYFTKRIRDAVLLEKNNGLNQAALRNFSSNV